MAEQLISETQGNEQPLTDMERATLESLLDGRDRRLLQAKQDERLADLRRRDWPRADRRGFASTGLLVILTAIVLVVWAFGWVYFSVAAAVTK